MTTTLEVDEVDIEMPAEDWFGPDTATFGDRVAAAREHAGLGQAELARQLGIKTATLKGWENDLSEPRANRLSMMAGLLNVSIMWLLTGEGDGMTGPDAQSADQDLMTVLSEIREIRAEMRQGSERLGRLEKKLRAIAEIRAA